MKTIKALIAVVLVSSFNMPVFAGTNTETAAGAVIGGLVGGAACRNCSPRSRNIAAGVAALAGGLVGNSMGDRSDRREAQVQQHLNNETTYVNRPVEPVLVASPRPTVQQDEVVVQRLGPFPAYRQTRYVQQAAPAPAPAGECDEQYYRGNYNPQAAHAYCEGRRVRERQVREAYEEGLAGN